MLAPLLSAVLTSAAQQVTGQPLPPHVTLRAEAYGPPSAPPLAYLELTGGFGAPGLDGGDTEIEFADVNDDGQLDLVSIGDHGSPFVNTAEHGVMVWFGDGSGGWTLVQNGNFGYGGIAVGDVDNDGRADLAYGMHHDYSSTDFGDQLIEVALGDGTGLAWTPWDDGLATNGESYGMFATDIADADNDGLLDVLSNSFGCCAGAHVYRNQGDGTWIQSFGFLGGNATACAAFGDVDADGNSDFAVGNAMGNVWRGDGLGGFASADANLPGSASSRQGFDFGDVDQDGALDYAFQSGGDVRVYRWAGGSWADLSGGLPRSSPLDLVQLADMDFDGHLDVVGFGGGFVAVFRGDGAGNWSLAKLFSIGTTGTAVALRAADVDHNGRPDLALLQDESCGFTCSENTPYFFLEASAPLALAVELYAPRGGETWVEGAVRAVEWQAALPSGAPGSATLALSVDGGPWLTLAAGAPNDGRHELRVPDGGATANARLRITVQAGPKSVSRTSAPFRILAAGGG